MKNTATHHPFPLPEKASGIGKARIMTDASLLTLCLSLLY